MVECGGTGPKMAIALTQRGITHTVTAYFLAVFTCAALITAPTTTRP